MEARACEESWPKLRAAGITAAGFDGIVWIPWARSWWSMRKVWGCVFAYVGEWVPNARAVVYHLLNTQMSIFDKIAVSEVTGNPEQDGNTLVQSSVASI